MTTTNPNAVPRWSVLCLEREVLLQPTDPGRKASCAPGEGSEQGGSEDTRSQEASSVGPSKHEEDEDDDEDEEPGEIPYVDMPGVSLEEELEEDCLAAAR